MKCTAVAISVFCLLYHAEIISSGEDGCIEERKSTKAVKLSVSSKRDQSGDLMTYFSVSKRDSDSTSGNVTLDLSQEETECGGKTTVLIWGVLSAISAYQSEYRTKIMSDKLRFHTMCGSNVAVINDGRTIQRINVEKDGNALTFTHRPLKSNELFEIMLDRKHNKFEHSLGIGLTTQSPKFASSALHINHIRNMSWSLYDGKLFYDGTHILSNFGRNVNSLNSGERVGVMRSNTGSLHYFVNGVDQGPAASSVPYPVYGVVELRGHALRASIVDS